MSTTETNNNPEQATSAKKQVTRKGRIPCPQCTHRAADYINLHRHISRKHPRPKRKTA